MKILNAEQMREADRLTSERYGVPSLQLMENAGGAIAEYVARQFPDLPGTNIVVLCGKGNNGGDGFVVARRLRERGGVPRVLLLAEPNTVKGDAAVNLKAWAQGGGELRVVSSDAEWDASRGALREADVIVDALLGTGISKPVEGLLARVIADVNAARGAETRAASAARERGAFAKTPRVIAVDMPSGLASGADDNGGPVIEADATVTLTAPKLGQMVSPRAECVGKLIVREIGTPRVLLDDDPLLKVIWLEPREFRGLPFVRRLDSNKGLYGHALIVAGSFGKSGAAVLAGRAALRVGAGLVTVATPASALSTVAAGMPELMTAPLAETPQGAASMANLKPDRIGPLTEGKSVVALGPGLTTGDETQQLVRTIVAGTHLPIVLDADGLNAFAGQPDALSARKSALLVITPHPGEMARLVGGTAKDVQSRRLQVALETAARWRAHVVLKGFHTILATPDGRAYINTNGNPGMATGGTGDVLTGILAGLTAEFGIGAPGAGKLGAEKSGTAEAAHAEKSAQAQPSREAAASSPSDHPRNDHWERVLGLGIYLHGLAGDIAAAKVGEAPLVASDLIEALPAAWAQVMAAAAT